MLAQQCEGNPQNTHTHTLLQLWEAGAGQSLQIPGQPDLHNNFYELHNETLYLKSLKDKKLGMMFQSNNPSLQETEAGELPWVWDQLGLYIKFQNSYKGRPCQYKLNVAGEGGNREEGRSLCSHTYALGGEGISQKSTNKQKTLKLKIELPYNSAIPPLGIITNSSIPFSRDICTSTDFVALFTVARP